MSVVEITSTLRQRTAVPFEKIARTLLPRGYQVSLVVCGDSLAQKMNKKYRQKTYRANVLTFPISKLEGEIFLNVRAAAREAQRFGISLHDRVAHLFIHACLHLKGVRHGATMDRTEERFVRRFGFQWPQKSTPESTSARITSK